MNKWMVAWRLIGVGWYIAACIVVGTLGGIWLDGKMDTKPLFTFLGLAGGLVLAFYGSYRILAMALKEKD